LFELRFFGKAVEEESAFLSSFLFSYFSFVNFYSTFGMILG
jgi:hypothetical protein